ncbi:MAG: hypothetical protein AAGB25_05885 [Pseudomonadota bacterium]
MRVIPFHNSSFEAWRARWERCSNQARATGALIVEETLSLSISNEAPAAPQAFMAAEAAFDFSQIDAAPPTTDEIEEALQIVDLFDMQRAPLDLGTPEPLLEPEENFDFSSLDDLGGLDLI